VLAGLIYATGTGERSAAALAAAGCEPGLSSESAPCITQQALVSQYMAVLTPASRQLGIDEAAYAASEGHHLAAAEAALTAAAEAGHAFDSGLAAIKFPPAIAPLAAAAVQAGQVRASLVGEQARSSSLTQMRSFDQRVQAADAAFQAKLKLLLKAIGRPPAAG
jgi:hypothetical protein